METYREYLDRRFSALPDSKANQKKKQNLLVLMTERYSDLLLKNTPEEDAHRTVIEEYQDLNDSKARLRVVLYVLVGLSAAAVVALDCQFHNIFLTLAVFPVAAAVYFAARYKLLKK